MGGIFYGTYSGIIRACANSVYQALLSPPQEPGNEAILSLIHVAVEDFKLQIYRRDRLISACAYRVQQQETMRLL